MTLPHRPSESLLRTIVQSVVVGCAVFAVSVGGATALVATEAAAETVDFRKGWRFSKGDPAGAERRDFDDAAWSPVRLPHDWAIAGPFEPNAPSGASGKLPWKGVGWYRKSFDLDCDAGDRVYLDFDGVMAFPKVYVNGKLAGEWDYGYTSFRVDATPYIDRHGPNVVAVRVDTTKHGTRWYPGAGIYRKVTLERRGPVHIGQWATRVTTPKVAADAATVNVETTVENHSDQPANVVVEVQLHHPNPKKSLLAGSATAKISIPPRGSQQVAVSIPVRNPERWDLDDPKLYTAVVLLHPDRGTGAPDYTSLDEDWVPFGIRTAELESDGFYLNGRRVQLRGVNLHHDLGPLGGAFYTRAMERQLEIMQDMGVNAIRTAHNPPAPELLDLCDRMGLLVWDECFDKWEATADRIDGKPSHEEHAERHLCSMVMRDRNHPCVFVWSIGNEIGPGGEGLTPERVAMMRDVVRKYDPTRPVGIACHLPDLGRGPMFDALDFVGWNYCRHYWLFHQHHPDTPVIYSESAAAVSTRGFYELPLPSSKTDYSQQHQVSSYDYNTAPWADVADREFALLEQDNFVAGDFVWSGIDYLGEPTPYDNDARSSYFGAVDLCGIPKDRFFLYRSHWRPDETTVHILPHWNWPERVGEPVPVFVYTNGDSAELFLNGRSLGRRTKGDPPTRPVNFAATARVTASSSRPDTPPELAVDENYIQRWFASSTEPNQWLELDLGESRPIKCLELAFERESKRYGYVVKASNDGREWATIVTHPASEIHEGGPENAGKHEVDVDARYLRIEIDDVRSVPWAKYWPCIREVGVYPEAVESAFYLPTYDYRLRWNEVPYEPGELKAIAYRNGEKIGEAVVRTAGAPTKLRLTADRTELNATGDDLCYVLVEALDKDGTLCPLADNRVTFTIDGPAEIAAVGNGNPMSFEPFVADNRKLFNGKAMLILRTMEGKPGSIRIVAKSDGLTEDVAACTVVAPHASIPKLK
jgi:beta-galactosidase